MMILVVFANGALAGQYYECKDAQGKKLFSQMPCPSQYVDEEVKVFKDEGSSMATEVSREEAPLRRDYAQELSDSNSSIRLNRQIERSEKKLEMLRQSYERDTSKLRVDAMEIGGVNARNRAQQIVEQIDDRKTKYIAERNKEIEALEAAKKELKEIQK
ncbi:DUF4124 domain-containing protein [Thalassolituus sp.]|jgi:hypothetical protein|uniref:DUF4124 domain-containing protein n=1 Tax=Thalassolituus sp. TaxID=2030822 RepID=UPI002A8171BA|nr:DUF4124 domain-containing protein [Thalassolituus sp.]|tara:strand:- start:2351 stop:2827 length:477 start_codon:yes stop_codon:yes gene_type:complete